MGSDLVISLSVAVPVPLSEEGLVSGPAQTQLYVECQGLLLPRSLVRMLCPRLGAQARRPGSPAPPE